MMEPDGAQVQADPNVVLSERIADVLVDEGLLAASRRESATRQIAAGKAKRIDWDTWAREAIKRGDTSDGAKTAD